MLQTSFNDFRRHIDEIVRGSEEAGRERHTVILSRLDILPNLETAVDEIRLQPPPNAHFTLAAQEILRQELGVSVNELDFTDPTSKIGESLFSIRFNNDNINLFGLTICGRIFSETELAGSCGPIPVNGNRLPVLDENRIRLIKGKKI